MLQDVLCQHLQVAEYVKVEEEARKNRVRMQHCGREPREVPKGATLHHRSLSFDVA